MTDSTQKARNVRLIVLFTILALMVAGLWYDRKVARPGVENAWTSIGALNDRINSRAEAAAMTNADVQQALNRQPTRTMTEGPYQVEVYSWMAGLPFRTRDYYAVYSPGNGKLLFLTHFKYGIPPDELNPPPMPADSSVAEADGSGEPPAEAAPEEGPRRQGRRSEAAVEQSTSTDADAGELQAEQPASEAASEQDPAEDVVPSSDENREAGTLEGPSDESRTPDEE